MSFTDVIPITLDTSGFDRAMRRMAEGVRAFQEALSDALLPVIRKTAQSLARFMEAATERANDPVNVAGLEGRFYVRAGLDPSYAAPGELDALVRSICAGDEPELLFVTPANRLVIATAAMRGWATHRGTGRPETLAWHRQMGRTHLVVTRSAA